MGAARVVFLGGVLLHSIAVAEPRFHLKVEPEVAFPMTGPQLDAFGVGGGGFVKPGYAAREWLDLQLSVGGLRFTGADNNNSAGLFGLGGGVRLKLPQRHYRFSPFVDVEPLYIRTGDFNRVGYTVGAGVLARDPFGFGPFGLHIRYLQVLQSDRTGFDTTDAHLLMFGISSQLGATMDDTDGDGVLDDKDKCPKVPGPAVNFGCPILDSDGDLLTDNLDKCPLVVGPTENEGCPWPDGDKDGVVDKVDRCPTEAGAAQNEGCPWPDTDGDTIVDREDKCPNVPGLPQFGGCPDKDNDGVPEPPDLCPDKAGLADNDGCPRYREIVVTSKAIELNQKIFFAYDKANILPKSFALLGEVATAFKDYPGLRVRIEGHTDSKGSLKHNTKLSQDRADAVLKYLVGQGVPPERFSAAQGYGPTQPLDTNKTPEGRERNRRVEFVVEGRGDVKPPETTPPETKAPETKPPETK